MDKQFHPTLYHGCNYLQVAKNRLESDINLKSEWREANFDSSVGRRMKMDERQLAAEMQISRKATVMVRQAKLRQLLEKEASEYENELHAKGKAFYISRYSGSTL